MIDVLTSPEAFWLLIAFVAGAIFTLVVACLIGEFDGKVKEGWGGMTDWDKIVKRLGEAPPPFHIVGRSSPWCYADILERMADRLDILALAKAEEMAEKTPKD